MLHLSVLGNVCLHSDDLFSPTAYIYSLTNSRMFQEEKDKQVYETYRVPICLRQVCF
jgi:hypothetical protein